jgi:hypothetical protein
MGFLDDVTPRDLENADSFSSFQIGDNIAYIAKVEETYSKNNNAMLVIHFEKDSGAAIRYYIVDNEYKFQKLKGLYLAFSIPFTEKNFQQWIGKQGVVVCKEGKPYNGETKPEVHYVKPLDNPSKNSAGADSQQPRWKDGTPRNGASGAATQKPPAQPPAPNPSTYDDGFDDDIPF